ncbi:MAG: hypothetical protein COA79_07550 [Planctomycetota bacterium]|nr:MAG: hypothetical protein COA79_07550 [Planctomycetota bacterium]
MFKIISLLLISVVSLSTTVYSQDKENNIAEGDSKSSNDLNQAKVPGKAIRQLGPYKLTFYVSKNWKRLRLEILDKKGKRYSIKDTTIKVSVRPSNRKVPFSVTMTRHSPKQQGVFISSHYVGKLKFIDHFDSFIVSTKVTINNRICSVEYKFSK